jgi:two-component system sensor histidine kinase PilS (NtrC family)
MSLALAIFVAALLAWKAAEASVTLVASVAMVAATAFTAGSMWYQLVYRGTAGRTFHHLQTLFDVLLVTAVVHVTGGASSQFAALYIMVTLGASLLLTTRGALLTAALAIALYAADVLVTHEADLGIGLVLQLGVFAAVALGVAYLSARLQDPELSRELLRSEIALAKLRAEDILRNIQSGIITIDERGRILFANPTAGEMLGFDSRRARGRGMAELIATPAPELAAALEGAVRRRQRITRGEATIAAHGRTFPIGLTTTTMEAAGAPERLSATAIFQDISDSKRMEELRLRAERLEAVAELSASLAHEIRNPLACIRSAVEQLALGDRASEDDRTLGQLIVRESDRLARLLSEFLDFARVQVADDARVDLCSIACSAVHLASAHPDGTARGVEIACRAPDRQLPVAGDADILHRAIFNVVLNAVQATPEHGTVDVEVAMLSAAQLPAGAPFHSNAVAIRVTDSGPGIPEELRDRVFDPFFTTRQGGTGLGLPIVHRAIAVHRGVVLLDSGASGTRFTVLLPLLQQAETAEAA